MKSLTTIEECLEHASEIRGKYRRALLEVGKSPDYHIYDLSYAFLADSHQAVAAKFLIKVKRFHDSLDVADQRIFVNEILEAKRHYAFWFLDFAFKRGEFESRKRSLLLAMPRRLS